MYSEKDLEAIKKEISNFDKELDFLKAELEKEIKQIRNKYKQKKKEILGKKSVLVKKIRWQQFSKTHYTPKDLSNSLAFQLFGKRAKDLTPEEKKEYNRIQVRNSRERRKM